VNKYDVGYIAEAPALIVFVLDPSKAGLGAFFGQKDGAMLAASACIQNIMLAATELGLETLWFTFFRPEALTSLLGVPEKRDIAGVIPIGKPKEEPKAPPRKDPIVHQQRYSE
jgi:nitroreductase